MAINYDRGPNDLEEVIDKLKKQKEILQNRLKNLNEDLQRELHDRKTND